MKRVFLYFFLAISTQLFAYPIDPRPLRMLIEESRYIVVGFVKEIVKTDPLPQSDWNTSKAIAIIEVREVLQGKIRQTIIEVPFSLGISCPASPDYRDSTLVLVFLDKKDGVFYTHALSYGAKMLKTVEDLQLYKVRIEEMQLILKINNKKRRFEQTVEWLVKCAENLETRWDGTFELSPESDFMSFYKQSELLPFGSALTLQQKERLKTVLFEQYTSMNYADLGLVDLVHDMAPEAVDQLLLNSLRYAEETDLYFVEAYMERLLHRTNNERAVKIKEAYLEYRYNDLSYTMDLEKLEKIWGFINEFLVLVE